MFASSSSIYLTFQFLLRPGHPPQPHVQEGGGRPVQVQAEQRADDVPHEGEHHYLNRPRA